MNTKVMEKNQSRKLPAGLFNGTEPFYYNNEKWVLHEGEAMRFHDAPGAVQRIVVNMFLNDRRSQNYLKNRMKITKFSEGFEWWYKCVVGGLDHIPDFLNGEFTPDAFNNLCTDYKCLHRGGFCGVKSGIRSHEVLTIIALKQGKSIAETATDLCVSTAGLKSRIEKIKEKLEAKNMASLIANAAGYGI